MKILALEFSSSQRSVALVEAPEPMNGPVAADVSRRTPRRESSGEMPPVLLARAAETAGRRAIGLIEEALRQANCEREQIEVIAVGLGPGSYTGIRCAIALAQGWQIGRGTNLLGVSSVAGLAAQALAAGMFGAVNIVIDAQRNEFYLARYQIDSSGARPIEALHLAGLSQIENLAREKQLLIGPEIVQWFPNAADMFPDAATLGRIASSRCDFVAGEKLEPIYLRETAFKKAPPPRKM